MTKAVAKTSNEIIEVPDYIKNANRGNENVSVQDIEIPRLELVQSLSPIRSQKSATYNPDAKEGQFYNTVTGELYDGDVLVCPVIYIPQFLLWKDRKLGGGFRGSFPTPMEAARHRTEVANEENFPETSFTISETHINYCVMQAPNGDISEIVLSMARSKLKVSKKWNAMIKMAGGDRFSRVYRIKSILETNSNGQDYHNIQISPAGFPSKEMYQTAESLYEAVNAGRTTVNFDDGLTGTEDEI